MVDRVPPRGPELERRETAGHQDQVRDRSHDRGAGRPDRPCRGPAVTRIPRPAEAESGTAVVNFRGPYETEAEARAAAACVYAAAHASSRRGVMTEQNHRLLCEAIGAAGTELGTYDHRIILWLAGWEPQVC